MAVLRRDFLKFGLAGLGTAFFPSWSYADNSTPHLFLFIHISGGADHSYLLDARPMPMTRHRVIQNYTNTNPALWTGKNQQSTWMSSSASALLPFKDDLTVVNGVVMDRQFIGHDQNTNVLFTGNPFGGDSFMPFLNNNSSFPSTPIDGLSQIDSLLIAALKNHGNFIPAGSAGLDLLSDQLKQKWIANPNQKVFQIIANRFKENMKGGGSFRDGVGQLYSSLLRSPELAEQMAQAHFPALKEADPDLTLVSLFNSLAQQKITRSGLVVISGFEEGPENAKITYGFDTHDSGSAQRQPRLFQLLSERIAHILKLLKTTAFDAKNSLFDVTTVMISSEFGRTLRQDSVNFLNTGTDHNPLCNSMMFCGKGVKGGLVLGQSDWQSLDETLSPAHLAVDPKKLNFVGRPFDFKNQQTILAPQTDFQIENYINSGNVINTLFDLFEVDKNLYRKVRNTSQVFPSLTSLLK